MFVAYAFVMYECEFVCARTRVWELVTLSLLLLVSFLITSRLTIGTNLRTCTLSGADEYDDDVEWRWYNLTSQFQPSDWEMRRLLYSAWLEQRPPTYVRTHSSTAHAHAIISTHAVPPVSHTYTHINAILPSSPPLSPHVHAHVHTLIIT